MKYANLHLHSTYSDAQFTPTQLYLIGKSLGYRAMAVTDHETDGGVKELMAYASGQGGMDVISGCEFYGKYDGVSLHLTALDYDMNDPKLRAFIQERVDQRNECTRKCVERGIKLGYISRNESAAVANVMDSGFAEECFGEITYINKKRESVGLLADCFFRCEDRYIERLKRLIEESKR